MAASNLCPGCTGANQPNVNFCQHCGWTLKRAGGKSKTGRKVRAAASWTVFLSIIVIVIGLVALTGGGEEAEPGSSDSLPGKQSVYEGIDATYNCDDLQERFDVSMDNTERYPAGHSIRKITRSYAEYTYDRGKELGCWS